MKPKAKLVKLTFEEMLALIDNIECGKCDAGIPTFGLKCHARFCPAWKKLKGGRR
jgi:hypothetical protein